MPTNPSSPTKTLNSNSPFQKQSKLHCSSLTSLATNEAHLATSQASHQPQHHHQLQHPTHITTQQTTSPAPRSTSSPPPPRAATSPSQARAHHRGVQLLELLLHRAAASLSNPPSCLSINTSSSKLFEPHCHAPAPPRASSNPARASTQRAVNPARAPPRGAQPHLLEAPSTKPSSPPAAPRAKLRRLKMWSLFQFVGVFSGVCLLCCGLLLLIGEDNLSQNKSGQLLYTQKPEEVTACSSWGLGRAKWLDPGRAASGWAVKRLSCGFFMAVVATA